jgi:hypothetical protein
MRLPGADSAIRGLARPGSTANWRLTVSSSNCETERHRRCEVPLFHLVQQARQTLISDRKILLNTRQSKTPQPKVLCRHTSNSRMLQTGIMLADDHIIKPIQPSLGCLEEIPPCHKLINPNLLPGTRRILLESEALRVFWCSLVDLEPKLRRERPMGGCGNSGEKIRL